MKGDINNRNIISIAFCRWN